MYVCMYVCNVCVYVCLYVRMYACMYVCIYVSMYLCMNTQSRISRVNTTKFFSNGQVIEGYMSTAAVYVVLAAGVSLALLAFLGLYAVRQCKAALRQAALQISVLEGKAIAAS